MNQHVEPLDLTLFVACYNEEANITSTLDTVMAACTEVGCSFEILIIDDGSTDRSVEIVRDYLKTHPECPGSLHLSQRNQGLAFNFVEGAFLGRGTWYRLICGDNVEPRETLVKVLSHMGKAELILSYRPDEVVGRSFSRKIISRTYTLLINLISGHQLKYYNGLPLLRRTNVMRWHSNSHGFGFQADLITRLLDRGLDYIEIPVSGQERAGGESKALTFRNFCSVSHTLLLVFIRRVAKILYGYN